MGAEEKGIWLVYDREGRSRNAGCISLYREHCADYQLAVDVVLDVDVERRVLAGERPLCAFVRTIRPEINRLFEEWDIPVFNSYRVSRICNHKGKTLAALQNEVLCVPSITVGRESLSHVLGMGFRERRRFFEERFSFSVFEENERALLCQAEDFVLKTVDGHGGSEVYSLGRERERIRAELGGIRSDEFVLQPLISYGCEHRDMRVYVIGGRVVAAVMRSSTGDFRANYSLGGEVCRVRMEPGDALTARIQKAVRRITGRFEFGMAGIDFLFGGEDEIILNEIEDVAGARMLYHCAPELDIVQQYVAYVLEEKLGRKKEDVQ